MQYLPFIWRILSCFWNTRDYCVVKYWFSLVKQHWSAALRLSYRMTWRTVVWYTHFSIDYASLPFFVEFFPLSPTWRLPDMTIWAAQRVSIYDYLSSPIFLVWFVLISLYFHLSTETIKRKKYHDTCVGNVSLTLGQAQTYGGLDRLNLMFSLEFVESFALDIKTHFRMKNVFYVHSYFYLNQGLLYTSLL